MPQGLGQAGSPGFCAFHTAKSGGVLLGAVHFDARAGFQIFQVLARQSLP